MIDSLANILGNIINYFYEITNNYGLAIILFGILAKIILFPISILIQKNSIKMVKIRPEIEELKFKYSDDKEKFMDEQIELFKREKYKPSLGTIPLILQIPIILSLIKVIKNATFYITNLEHTYFMGIDLSIIPSLKEYIIIPILAAISCVLLCTFQNKENVLQKEEPRYSKVFTVILTTSFTIYFVVLVPAGVGLYWMCGNILAIIQMYILNYIYPPKKYIDYEKMNYWKNKRREKEIVRNLRKKDYKKFLKEENMRSCIFCRKRRLL